jgi:hypothetical protein
VTSLATGEALPTLRRAARHYNGLESRVRDSCLYEQTGSELPVTVLESTGPGEDSTGAGAERELGFDPNRRPSSRRASTKEQGKY